MKVVFMCEFCEGIFDKEHYAIEHEGNCDYNPLTKRCPTCKNYWEDEDGYGCKLVANVIHSMDRVEDICGNETVCKDYRLGGLND